MTPPPDADQNQLSEAVSYQQVGDVAVLRFDDGKANALGHDAIAGLNAGLDQATEQAKAVAIIGREGKFCAGFDLQVMTKEGPDAARELLGAGAELFLRMYLHPQPVIAGCTGHALAAGAIMLESCDVRIGAAGPYKLGTNEVAISMQLPRFAMELARDRLSKRHFQAATQLAQMYDPDTAVDAGYLDQVVELADVETSALDMATALAGALHPRAFAQTRGYARDAVAERYRAGLALDLGDFTTG